MQQEVIYPKFLDAVKYAVDTHSDCLKGKGKVSGRQFSELIKKAYDQANPINSNAAELAAANIDNIEVLDSGTIRWQFK